jgi:hypothetical protein
LKKISAKINVRKKYPQLNASATLTVPRKHELGRRSDEVNAIADDQPTAMSNFLLLARRRTALGEVRAEPNLRVG